MNLLLFVTVFVAAAAASYIALSRRIDETLGGAVAAALWLRLVPASFNLQAVSNGSTVSLATDPASAILVGTLGVLMGVFAVGSVLDRIPDRSDTRFAEST
jgi:hypothetical protein